MAEVTAKREQVDYSKLWWVTLLAGVVAAVVNVIVFLITQALGAFDETVVVMMGESEPFDFFSIIVTSIVLIAVGGAVVWVVDRFSHTPVTTWRNVAIVALILSFGMPFAPGAFENPTLPFYASLLLMHIIAGVIAIYMITTMAKK